MYERLKGCVFIISLIQCLKQKLEFSQKIILKKAPFKIFAHDSKILRDGPEQYTQVHMQYKTQNICNIETLYEST